MTEVRKAKCSCGQLSVTCEGSPVSVSLCHCIECQRRTGSTYGVAAFFNEAKIQVAGKSSKFTRPTDSGHSVTFDICPNCGSSVFWKPFRKAELVAIAMGIRGSHNQPCGIRLRPVEKSAPPKPICACLDPSRKSGGALHRLHCFCLEFDGACEVQRRVPTDWIIEPVDVSGYGSFSLAS